MRGRRSCALEPAPSATETGGTRRCSTGSSPTQGSRSCSAAPGYPGWTRWWTPARIRSCRLTSAEGFPHPQGHQRLVPGIPPRHPGRGDIRSADPADPRTDRRPEPRQRTRRPCP